MANMVDSQDAGTFFMHRQESTWHRLKERRLWRIMMFQEKLEFNVNLL